MKKRKKGRIYKLDNFASIHFASMKKGYSNSFRMEVDLDEEVSLEALQAAVDKVAPRFPTIVAGIKLGWFSYYVVPAKEAPKVEADDVCLAFMPIKMIKNCAVRVIYDEHKIAIEVFHSLTDGYGGLKFLEALLAQYFAEMKEPLVHGKYKIYEGTSERKVEDSSLEFVAEKGNKIQRKTVYCLPGSDNNDQTIEAITGVYDTNELIEESRKHGVSLTSYLTAALVKCIIEVQKKHKPRKKEHRPIQIMVPINLRNKFESITLRNFSLYAFAGVNPDEQEKPFEKLVHHIAEQIKTQNNKKHLEGLLTTNVGLQKIFVYKIMPLSIKRMILKISFRFFGEKNSCMTLSNLGEIKFPESIEKRIKNTRVFLTPRRDSPYNIGINSYNGKTYINFTKKGKFKGLEVDFFKFLPRPDKMMVTGN